MYSNTIDSKGIEERNLFLTKGVDQHSIGEIVKQIVNINAKDDAVERIARLNGGTYYRYPISIYIDSYGGLVYQILGLISIIESSETPVHTIVTGCAMSCGFMLLISGHKRFAMKHSTGLYHQVSDDSWGKIEDLKDRIHEAERLQNVLEDIAIEKTSLTKEQLLENRRMKKDWVMTPEEMLVYKVIDQII